MTGLCARPRRAVGRPAVRPFRAARGLFARYLAARRRVPVASYAQSLWQFQLSIGLCVGLGAALIGNVPNSILLGRWFGPRLPTAMAVVYRDGRRRPRAVAGSQLLIDHLDWRGAYQLFGIGRGVLVPLLLLPWRRFAAGSPHAARGAGPTRRRRLDAGQRHAPPRLLGAVLYFLLHRGRDVLALGAGRGLSDRRRISAAAGRDRLGLFGRGAAVRHARRQLAGRPHRPPAVRAARLRSRSSASSCSGCSVHPNIWLLAGFMVSFGSMIGSRGPCVSGRDVDLRGKRVGTISG